MTRIRRGSTAGLIARLHRPAAVSELSTAMLLGTVGPAEARFDCALTSTVSASAGTWAATATRSQVLAVEAKLNVASAVGVPPTTL